MWSCVRPYGQRPCPSVLYQYTHVLAPVTIIRNSCGADNDATCFFFARRRLVKSAEKSIIFRLQLTLSLGTSPDTDLIIMKGNTERTGGRSYHHSESSECDLFRSAPLLFQEWVDPLCLRLSPSSHCRLSYKLTILCSDEERDFVMIIQSQKTKVTSPFTSW